MAAVISYWALALAALAIHTVYLVLKMIKNGRNVEIPGKVAKVYSFVMPGDLGHWFLPRIPYIHAIPFRVNHLAAEHLFRTLGVDTFCVVGPNRIQYFSRDLPLSKDAFLVKRKEVNKPVQFYGVLNFFGLNIVTVEGKEWLRHRTVIQPAFSDANLRFVADCTAEFTNETIASWKSQSIKSVNIDPELIRITMKVICKAGFGVNSLVFDRKAKTTESGSTKLTLADALTVVSEDTHVKLLMPDFLLRHLPIQRVQRVRDGFDIFKDFLYGVIKNRQEGNISEGKDLMNLLLQANDNDAQHHLTDEEIVANTYIFMLAGHETTAHTLLWAFNLLAMHPEIQDKAYREVVEVLGHDRDPNYDDYRSLVYSEAIMKEVLRLFPPVVGIPKSAVEDVDLGGVSIPKGTYIDINAYSMGRHAKYWKDPDAFIPERFDERVSAPVDPNLFVSFSRGPRGCIGFRFALIEGTIILSMLLRKFKFRHPSGTDYSQMLKSASAITLKPTSEIHLEIEPRAASDSL